MVITAT